MRMRSLCALAAPAILIASYLVVASVTTRAQESENPYTTRLDVRMGQRLYQQQCGRCLGQDGGGGELGPALDEGFRNASTDAGLFRIVREGIPNTQMIGISRNATDQSAWMVVSFLNSLNNTADVDLPGNASNGQQLFAGKGNCSSCHMLNGTGGRRGPELTAIGSRRDPEELRASLTDPNDDVPPRWWTVRVTREDGSVVEGLRMNEDTFSLRIMDENEALWSFLKGSVQSHERIKTSIMPDASDTLTVEELDDLIAYLFSLKREDI